MPNLLESLVPTTELEAVNAMRAVNGDSPVDDLNSPLSRLMSRSQSTSSRMSTEQSSPEAGTSTPMST